ncbi:MAG: hypothetical protein JW818_00615 [Pirellulales bacterium]|nr:hypothetical protein [Pirellulales bacterium]
MPEIREQVELEYADRLDQASWLGRLRLRREIDREIARRTREQAPPDALY